MNKTKNSRRQFLGGLGGLGGAMLVLSPESINASDVPAKPGFVNVRDFGATGNRANLGTTALQAAIDTCATHGGGTVYFPAGTYLSGTLFLKSHIILHLDAGATLLGSTDLKDYPSCIPAFRSYTDVNYTERSLIYAEKASHIGIVGQGTINGQGEAKSFQRKPYKQRPYLIRMIECQNITLRDVTIRNSPMWVQHYLACDDLLIDGITVESLVNGNNDGIDIDGCHRVRIANCRITSGDDAIVLKSTSPRECNGVTITNCVLSSWCNAFKCGTESTGGFRDIVLSNCVIQDTRLSGIALELVDGGTLDGITISNVRMSRTRSGIFLRLGHRARPYLAKGPGGGSGTFVLEEGMKTPGVGRFRNVHISQVMGHGGDVIGCAIAGLPEQPIENVVLDQVRLEFAGGGRAEDAQREIPENAAAYPEYPMFGRLPAYGFYCRHVRNLRLAQVELGTLTLDARPALVCDDVDNIEIRDCQVESTLTRLPVLQFKNVRNAFIHGCRCPETISKFASFEGASSAKIKLLANDFSEHTTPATLSDEVSAREVIVG